MLYFSNRVDQDQNPKAGGNPAPSLHQKDDFYWQLYSGPYRYIVPLK